MTYLHCDECGYEAVSGPMSLVGDCPRCRLHGRAVSLIELRKAPPYARTSPQGGALVSERGMRAPS